MTELQQQMTEQEQVKKFAEQCGFEEIRKGIFIWKDNPMWKGLEFDLSASGGEPWMVMSNISNIIASKRLKHFKIRLSNMLNIEE